MSKITDIEMQTVEVEVLKSKTCDLCGKREECEDPDYSFVVEQSFYSFIWTGGYHSNYDGQTFSLDICDDCIAKHGKPAKQ